MTIAELAKALVITGSVINFLAFTLIAGYITTRKR